MRFITLIAFSFLILLGFLLPESYTIPVKDAHTSDWNHQSYWSYPWGKSIVHKGIDIFSKKGKEVVAATNGIVVYKGSLGIGENAVVVAGPKWRFHYYAHLKSFKTGILSIVKKAKPLVMSEQVAMPKSSHRIYIILFLRLFHMYTGGTEHNWVG